jgi:DNA segregation ATPase FtsK/SpoIIIE, S-DNA-T family
MVRNPYKPSKQPKPRRTQDKKTRGKSPPASASPLSNMGWNSLSEDRQRDIIGVVCIFAGILALISLFLSNSDNLIGLIANALFSLAGWGAFLLPLGLLAFGAWMVTKNRSTMAVVSGERVTGIILFSLNLLTWMHLLTGGWEEAALGRGGGYLGALFSQGLQFTLGYAGTVVVLAAWLVIALELTLDISTLDLIKRVQPMFDNLKSQLFQAGPFRAWPAADSPDANKVIMDENGEVLPPDFLPLSELGRLRKRASKISNNQEIDDDLDPDFEESEPDEVPMPVWNLPSVDSILDPVMEVALSDNMEKDRAHLIEETLASLGAPGHVVEVHRGPTITQYGVEPDFIESRGTKTRVRVSKIANLADDLALALAASRIRIQAPVPGKSYVGIEVPNLEFSPVRLRELLESETFAAIKSPLKFALGKDVSGNPVAVDLASLPHLLIAGTTGSGKSVCLNVILSSFLLHNSPSDLRLILVDPKRVELTGYNGIPHLLTPVIVDANKVIRALQWVMREMDNRYRKFTKAGVRDIAGFNANRPQEHLAHLIVVIDELADLMMLAPDETERNITRLAQLARATGIHLILATQRPSVNVVTGLIKANIPARIAFAVAQNVDSRVILDHPGAERLLGRGDMLYQSPDAPAPVRLQGAFVSDNEIQLLVDYWQYNAAGTEQPPTTSTSQPEGVDSLPRGAPLKQIPLWDDSISTKEDPILPEAIELARREGRASVTMLQRRLRVGYTRAARLIDTMEEQGIVGPAQPPMQVREILDYGPTAPPVDDGY